jgi:hypothetical protein
MALGPVLSRIGLVWLQIMDWTGLDWFKLIGLQLHEFKVRLQPVAIASCPILGQKTGLD